ncbi:hypothetical protein BV898_01115 [Hypsibius exemplaris]|uniref:39S ribosomal protein L55, mitochondrial n=1 Tax=Hypsibius exemplaris TaxID=2072580 RepID=A0A1W0XDC4_HYPEX|nr:hypothetical protein BV898_01115 [Hypsibius exemplaris]
MRNFIRSAAQLVQNAVIPSQASGLASVRGPSSIPFHARFNSNRAGVAKIGRTTYTRLYPTMIVQPDGSTINIRYKEPRRIITLPFDLTTLTEEEQRLRLLKRRPKVAIKLEEEIDDGFKAAKYLLSRRKK